MLTRRAEVGDLDRCAHVLGEAFADYAWTRWTVDSEDHERRVTALQRLALERYGLPHGQVWVTLLDGAPQSVAVWMDSAVPVPPPPGDVVAELEGARHEASVAAERQLAGLRPTERHYYLGAIGTSPSARRRGLGTMTLAPVLAAADDEGVCAFLETSSKANVAFYERLGFRVSDHRQIAGGGPDVWAMLRSPRRRRVPDVDDGGPALVLGGGDRIRSMPPLPRRPAARPASTRGTRRPGAAPGGHRR